MTKLSKNELIHMLKKEIKHNKQLQEIIDRQDKTILSKTKQWNDFQIENNVGSINAWLTLKDYFENNADIQYYYKNVSQELNDDGCCSKTSCMITTIKKLLEKAIEYDEL